jgi:hypothetical protein
MLSTSSSFSSAASFSAAVISASWLKILSHSSECSSSSSAWAKPLTSAPILFHDSHSWLSFSVVASQQHKLLPQLGYVAGIFQFLQ